MQCDHPVSPMYYYLGIYLGTYHAASATKSGPRRAEKSGFGGHYLASLLLGTL